MRGRAAVLVAVAVHLTLMCAGSGNTLLDMPLCSGNSTLAWCLSDDVAIGGYARLFPGVHSDPWLHVPVKRNGEPVTVHLADSELLAKLREGLTACRAAAHIEAWRLEHQQMAQGGAIDLAWQLALSAYPHLVDDPAAADVVVAKLPLVLALQMWDTEAFTCGRNLFGGALGNSGGAAQWQEIKQLSARAVAELSLPSEKLFWAANYWRMGSAAGNVFNAQGIFSDFGMRSWHKKYRNRFVYVPSTPLETLARMVGNCPCLFDADKDVPFFMIGAGRGHPVRERLARVAWSRFPGSVVEITNVAFVRTTGEKAADSSVRYAALMARSKFCLITSGDSENVRRVFEAIVAGCVPVFMSEWRERRPFSWLHNGTFWDHFTVPVKDYSTINSIQAALDRIYAMPAEHYQLLRQKLRLAVADVAWTFGNPEQPIGKVLFGRAPLHTLQEIVDKFIQVAG